MKEIDNDHTFQPRYIQPYSRPFWAKKDDNFLDIRRVQPDGFDTSLRHKPSNIGYKDDVMNEFSGDIVKEGTEFYNSIVFT